MRRIICCLLFFIAGMSVMYGQMRQAIFKQSFDSLGKQSIHVHSGFGSVFVQPSFDQLGTFVEVIYEEELADEIQEVIDHIEILVEETDSTVHITTRIDDSILGENGILSQNQDKINIQFRTKVPPHMSYHVHQTIGRVLCGRISNPIFIHLTEASLVSKLTDQMTITGEDFSIDVSGTKSIEVQGVNGQLIMSNIGAAELNLEKCTVQSIGFKSLVAELNDVQLSAGRTNNVQMNARNSTLEFTDVQTLGNFSISDTRLVVQKLPESMSLRADGGKSSFGLHPQRHVVFNTEAENHEMDITLRGGTYKMEQKAKKSTLTFPDEAVVSKKAVEWIQRDSHGVKMVAEFKRVELDVHN